MISKIMRFFKYKDIIGWVLEIQGKILIQINRLVNKMDEKWFDVLDEDGVWRVGECLYQDQKGMKNVAFDGFHSNYTSLFCQHSQKILPIRSKTVGLTVPEGKKPLRQVLSANQVQNVAGRLNLYMLKPNLLQFDPKLIRESIRTQFLVIVDKIVSTPFEIIRQTKMLDVNINNFFINLLNLFIRIMDFSKAFMKMLDNNNQTASQLYYSIYEQTIMVKLILGMHEHSQILYDHKLNILLKPSGLIDFLVKSEGINPFRTFIKSSTAYIKNKKQKQSLPRDLQISLGVIDLGLEICDKSKQQLFQGDNRTRTSLFIDDIITHIKTLAESDEKILSQLANNITLIAQIQNIYSKLKPNRQCPIRKYLTPPEEAKPAIQISKENAEQEKIDEQTKNKMYELELRVKQMEKSLMQSKLNQNGRSVAGEMVSKLPESVYPPDESPYNFPTENLGEELFLASVQWALECGDNATAKKLVKWRKSLLQVGRVVGWETALLIGCKTLKKAQITTEDIIEANYEILLRNHNKH